MESGAAVRSVRTGAAVGLVGTLLVLLSGWWESMHPSIRWDWCDIPVARNGAAVGLVIL